MNWFGGTEDCVCECVCVCKRESVSVCVCVRERERERERVPAEWEKTHLLMSKQASRQTDIESVWAGARRAARLPSVSK